MRALLSAFVLLLCAAAAPAAFAHGLAEEHGDPRGALPDSLVTQAVAAAELGTVSGRSALTPGGMAPETWCGVATTSDDVANARYPAATPQLKLVYAHASDQPDRFASLQDRLQGNVSLLARYVATQSGGRKALRWDMGTSCGPAYVDIQVLRLPRTLATYTPGGVPDFGTLRSDVTGALGPSQSGPRNWVVYADGFYNGTSGVAGTATLWRDEAPNAVQHDRGRNVAAVFGPSALNGLGAYAWPSVMFHEIAHNLGAVQYGAPHSSKAGHCFDRYDVMCYPDGGTQGMPADMTYTCPRLSGQAVDETLDCGGDDYFNPAPAPGSYLDTHWNVFDSAHLGLCSGELADMCGVAPGGGDVTAPTNTTPLAGAGWRRSYAVVLSGADTESPVTGFQWRVDGGAAQSSLTATVPAVDGAHTLQTRVGDAAGNWSSWRTETVRIDRTAPTASVRCAAAGGQASCAVHASDNGGSGLADTTWSLDGGPSQPLPIAVTGAGARLVAVTVTDEAGNAAVATATLNLVAPTAPTRVTTATTPAPPAAPATPRAAAVAPPRTLSAVLRRAGRTLAAGSITVAGDRARVTLRPAKLARGTWRLKACAGTRCVTRTVTVGANGRAGALTGSLPSGDRVVLSLERRAGRRFRFQARATVAVR